MKNNIIILIVIAVLFVLMVGCSVNKDTSSMETSEVITKTQAALEILSGKSIHTVEKTELINAEGTDTIESERWYANGNCLYVGTQSNGITTSLLQYGNNIYTKTSIDENWRQIEESNPFAPFGVNKSDAQQVSEDAFVSWKEENGEYCVVFISLPQGGIQNYTKNQTSFYFTAMWELLRIENLAEYSMESWVDGTITETVSNTIIEYQATEENQIKKQIEDTYRLIGE